MGKEINATRMFRYERTRKDILDSAAKLIWEKGFENFSLREVAKRVHYSPAALYEYFDSKESILLALGQRAQEKLGKAMEKALFKSKNPILAISEAYIDFAKKNKEDFLLLFSRLVSSRRDLKELEGNNHHESPFDIVVSRVKDYLPEKAIKDSLLSAEEIAYGIWSMVHGQAMLQVSFLEGFKADFLKTDKRIMEIFIKGLLKS